MTNYTIPFDTHFEDKIFGGKLTFKQGMCYVPAVVLIICLASIPQLTTNTVNGHAVFNVGLLVVYIFLDIILFVIGTILGFTKINGDSLIKYLIKKFKFATKENVIKFYQ